MYYTPGNLSFFINDERAQRQQGSEDKAEEVLFAVNTGAGSSRLYHVARNDYDRLMYGGDVLGDNP
jgi:hypothetical protein